MRTRHLYIIAIAVSIVAALPVLADQSRGGGQRSGAAMGGQRGMTQDRMHDQDRLRDREPIYGSQLMIATERNAYRKKMRSLKTRQEREAFRMQHHQEMQKRAAARGMTLPDTPPARPGRAGMGNPAGVRQRTQQQTEQQERNQRQDQQIRQRQRTEQQEHQSQDDGG